MIYNAWQHDRQPKHHSFLLVRTTSDATLDAGSGKASNGLTQEQPEERIGSAKDPQRFCLTIAIKSLNKLFLMIRFIISALCPGVQSRRHESFSCEDVCFQCFNH